MTSMKTFAELLDINASGDERLRFLGEAAYMWMYLGNVEKASLVFDGLTVLAPSDPVGHLGLAEVAMRAGRYKDVEKEIDLALRSGNVDRRTTAYAYIVRGQASLGRGRPADAQKAWTKAEKLDPGSSEAELARQWLEALKEWKDPGDSSVQS